jgi:hypothetical protein
MAGNHLRPRLKGTGCPFCSGHKCCECSSLAAQRPDLMRDWDWKANEGIDPHQICLASSILIGWRCNKSKTHGRWVATVRDQVLNGSGCPNCAKV